MPASTIAVLKNLGPKSEQWLNHIGVYTLDDLKIMGAVDCCLILRTQGYPISLNLAYAIEGAIRDIHWTKLPDNIKYQLRKALAENHD